MNYAALVAAQRDFFRTGATLSLEFRREQLRRLEGALRREEARLVEALAADLHKSPAQAHATELGLVMSDLAHARRHLPRWVRTCRRKAPLLAWPARGFVRPEPYGVALILGAWNYPVHLLLSPLVGAMAAGNCAVLKPSEYAPHTAEAVRRLVGETFPENYLAVVPGEREVGESLLRERFDKVFFTGSARVGRAVMAAAARHLTPITLELGGKCPCIVCADAPMEVTARRIAWGKFLNAGQTCVAPDFVLADRRIAPALVEALKRAILHFYGEDPQRSPDYGRIVNRRHLERLVGLLGAGERVHGGQYDAESLYLAPTILTRVPREAPVMQEEIFGPILPVLEFESLEAALRELRELPTPLALYVFSKDRDTQRRVLASVRSGGVCFNDTIVHTVGKDLPFGGLGESGFGAYHGKASFECFTHYRAVLRRAFWPDIQFRYPPARVSLVTLKRALVWLLRH